MGIFTFDHYINNASELLLYRFGINKQTKIYFFCYLIIIISGIFTQIIFISKVLTFDKNRLTERFC